jgi:hypothetical protein
MTTDTTRRHPRTMLQAWPDRYPGCISHYRRPLAQRVADALFTVVIAAGAGVALFYGLSA